MQDAASTGWVSLRTTPGQRQAELSRSREFGEVGAAIHQAVIKARAEPAGAQRASAYLLVLDKVLKALDGTAFDNGALNAEARRVLAEALEVTRGHKAQSQLLRGACNSMVRMVNVRSTEKQQLVMDVYSAMYRLDLRLRQPTQILPGMLQRMLPMEAHPAASQVTFLFFRGVECALEEQIEAAEWHLVQAFDRIAPQHPNKRRVFEFLAPLRLVLGRAPSSAMLQRFGVAHRYGALMAHVRQGNAAGVRAELRAHRAYFTRVAAVGPLSRLEYRAYRNLLRHCVAAVGPHVEARHVLALSAFREATPRATLDRFLCVFAQLEARGLVKGRLCALEPLVVELRSDAEAFPKRARGDGAATSALQEAPWRQAALVR